MSKERLEEIEKNLDPLGYGMGGHLISVNDIYWLVKYAKEQAERAHELEQQNKCYRKALEEIRDIGICGKIISTGEIIRSNEAFLKKHWRVRNESNKA